jgi:hypothetical protein
VQQTNSNRRQLLINARAASPPPDPHATCTKRRGGGKRHHHPHEAQVPELVQWKIARNEERGSKQIGEMITISVTYK